ncbi:MAG: hypothetical protein H6741_20435 [Alphaproteobacteria bacterium]|nr:hypothetical protein [Alphaproteobacteria bacterium]
MPDTTPALQPAFDALRLGDLAGAQALLEQAEDPALPHPHQALGLGLVAELTGQPELALRRYARAYELGPLNVPLGLHLSALYLEQGEREAAARVLNPLLGVATGAEAEEARRLLDQAESRRTRQR